MQVLLKGHVSFLDLFFYLCKNNLIMKAGDKAKIDPQITGLKTWIEGIVIKIRKNPFLGTEIAVKDDKGVIYFDVEKYFKPVTN